MQVRPSPAKASGAALTETFLVAIILVPLLFGTAMLGKLIDLKQTAVLASRYAVWETTVHGGGARPEDVQARFFAGDVRREGGTGAVEPAASGDAGARGPVGVLPSDTRVAVSPEGASALRPRDPCVAGGPTGEPGSPSATSCGTGVAAAVGGAVARAGDALGGATGGEWGLTANGLVRGGVAVPVDGNGWTTGTVLEETSVILHDGWSASGTAQLERRARSLVPAGALESVADVLSAVSAVPILKELGGLEGALGKVDASTLPPNETAHRLESYREPRP